MEADPKIRAVLLECTELPPCAAAVPRAARPSLSDAAAWQRDREADTLCRARGRYADAIRHATGLLTLDVITLIDYFHAAVSPNPYFGID